MQNQNTSSSFRRICLNLSNQPWNHYIVRFSGCHRRHPKENYRTSCGHNTRTSRSENFTDGSARVHWNYREPGTAGNGLNFLAQRWKTLNETPEQTQTLLQGLFEKVFRFQFNVSVVVKMWFISDAPTLWRETKIWSDPTKEITKENSIGTISGSQRSCIL